MKRMKYIESSNNKKVKEIRSLFKKKNRLKTRSFIIEGLKIVEECLDKDYPVNQLVISQSFSEDLANEEFLARLEDKDLIYVSDRIFSEITDMESPQGILAVVPMIDRSMESFKSEGRAFYLLLDELQDPGNMGTIIRSGDAFGVDGIFLTKGCVDIYNPKVVRSTMGSIFRTKIYNIESSSDLEDLLEEEGLSLYSTSLEASDHIEDLDFNKSIFVIGNESKGVSEEYLELSHKLVKIPMVGEAESLNAGVAASIVMYASRLKA